MDDLSPDVLKKKFLEVKSRAELAALLKVSEQQLIYYLYRIPHDRRYFEFQVSKRGAGERKILAPASALKLIQARLNTILQPTYGGRDPVHGFQKSRSILSNAQKHVRRRYVLNVDLSDFFASINFGRVRGLFLSRPYDLPKEVATLLAQLACHDNELPQGAPSSPTIANMVCGKLDAELVRLCRNFDCYYTRYADDITISCSSNIFPKEIALNLDNQNPRYTVPGRMLKEVIHDNGFAINEKKMRLQKYDSRQVVTGLVVNKTANVPRRYVRQIRAMLHAWEIYGETAAEVEYKTKYDHRNRSPFKPTPKYRDIVKGKINFLKMIKGQESPIYQTMRMKFNFLAHGIKPETDATIAQRLREAVWVLEDEELSLQGTAFFLKNYGLITCEHVLTKNIKAFHPDSPAKRYNVKVKSRNKDIDLAILEIDAEPNHELTRRITGKPKHSDPLRVAGYPNFRPSDSIYIAPGYISGFRVVSTIERILTDAPIIAGNSGGPVLDSEFNVLGIAATGADCMEESPLTHFHSIIPISAIDKLSK